MISLLADDAAVAVDAVDAAAAAGDVCMYALVSVLELLAADWQTS